MEAGDTHETHKGIREKTEGVREKRKKYIYIQQALVAYHKLVFWVFNEFKGEQHPKEFFAVVYLTTTGKLRE